MSTIINNNPICDKRLQKILSALIVTVCFILVYGLCRCFLAPLSSALLTLVFVLGSPLISTMGTALWSLDMEVMFILLCLLMIVYDDRKIFTLNPYVLSFFLFSAYLCRPTAAIFVALVALYVLLFKPRAAFIKLSASYLLFFMVFVLFSLHEYKSILPPYYLQRFSQIETFWTGLYGILLSPARGLLVYSPYLLLTLLGLCCFFKEFISVAIDVVGNPVVFLPSCYDRAISRVVGGALFWTTIFNRCISRLYSHNDLSMESCF